MRTFLITSQSAHFRLSPQNAKNIEKGESQPQKREFSEKKKQAVNLQFEAQV